MISQDAVSHYLVERRLTVILSYRTNVPAKMILIYVARDQSKMNFKIWRFICDYTISSVITRLVDCLTAILFGNVIGAYQQHCCYVTFSHLGMILVYIPRPTAIYYNITDLQFSYNTNANKKYIVVYK